MSKARTNAETLRTALVAGDVTNANFTGADLEVGKGGTGASTAGAARTALGVAIGSDVLAPDGSAANLTNLPAGGAEDFVASGTLPNGKPVILKANGQVEVVAETGISQSIPAGSETVFNAANTTSISVAYDPNNANKFLLIYRDVGNSGRGTALVGTVSGTSMSFGSEATFSNTGHPNTFAPSVSFDPHNANKFAFAYQAAENNYYGQVIVGTISGTSVSFGTAVLFKSAIIYEPSLAFDPYTANKYVVTYRSPSNGEAIVGTISGTSSSFGSVVTLNSGLTHTPVVKFDPNTANKCVIIFKDQNNSYYGTAVVGTVSGTSISFGSEVVFNTGNSGFLSLSFDKNTANKFVVGYLDGGNGEKGTAIIGTISGTSTSFGTEVVFNSGPSQYVKVAYDPHTANKFVAIYKDENNSNYGTAIVGTVSGTSISYGSEAVFNSGVTNYLSISFDTNTAGKFIVVYNDAGNSNYGAAILGQLPTSITNLTATNFLGTATAAYTNGQTASIMLKGGISDNQTSLAIGSTYYVQPNGTFATSAGTPSVIAGKAVSATSLLLNGLAPAATPDEIPSQTGNTGKFLTTNGSAASWGAVPAAGLTLLGTVTGSNASTISFGDVMSSTYHTYVIYGEGIYPAANNDYLNFRVKMGGSFSSASMYNHSSVGYRSSTDSALWQGGYNQNNVFLSNGLSNSSSQGGGLTLHIHNPNATSAKTGFDWTHSCQRYTNESLFYTGGGSINNSSAITSIRFACNNGNINGTFRIYGVSK